jgi:phosphoribosylpyrophosphate synthetase
MKVITDFRLETQTRYPIGANMENVMEYSKVFAELVKRYVSLNTRINFLVRGSSGAILGGIVSSLLIDHECIISHIKKDGEISHNFGNLFPKDCYNIIIDDFISTGSTVREIYSRFKAECHIASKVNMLVVSGYVSSCHIDTFVEELDIIICGKDNVSTI